MSRSSLATPCPAPSTWPSQRLSIAALDDSFGDDDCTEKIDYTRAIQQEFNNARPKRSSALQRKAKKYGAPITIFEDVLEGQEIVAERTKTPAKSTLLGKPAQRMRIHGGKKEEEPVAAQPLGEIGQARRRISVAPRLAPMKQVGMGAPWEQNKHVNESLKKEARRRTIFVPTDDTTIMTIHPGANSTERLDDTFQLPEIVTEPSPISEHSFQPEVQPRRSRMSLAVAPRRLPLQHVAAKQNVPGVDMPGQNGGKENVPPNTVMADMPDDKPTKPAVVRSAPAKPSPARSRLYESTAASQARQTIVARKPVPMPNAQSIPLKTKATVVQRTRPAQHKSPVPVQSRSTHSISPASRSAQAPKLWKRTTPPKHTTLRASKLSKYLVLSEDVSQPQLYEDSWLSHQEVALTELINEIFTNTRPVSPTWQAPTKSLREHMLDIYHQPNVTAMHKRLQASLLYGALSRQKDMPSPPNPAHDLGLRKRFLNLWLHTYDVDALRAAAEVVVGRQMPSEACRLSNDLAVSESVLDPSKNRRALIGFLEAFFINMEDVNAANDEEPGSVDSRRWRKMILRSSMLIWLLDQAKASGSVAGCLFKRSSIMKSSTAVLYSLSSLLIPSVGDITRVLRHLDYEVNHVQDPLDEVVYRIENIAVDLRDGIFLTRLVEVMLFTSQRREADSEDATVTIALPDATVLESAMYMEDGSPCPRILSQHLAMPCLGRAQKVHNVQVALSALVGHADLVIAGIEEITADDIVDGHREKTLSLLWSLASNYGLAQLLDWDELTADIQRTGVDTSDISHASQSETGVLLQAWATTHCRSQGVRVNNLTTSFADGKAYCAILDNFSAFITDRSVERHRTTSASLDAKLRTMGCSNAFIKQLTASTDAIPTRNATVSNLAFLASRLLPSARRHNAVMVIQRAFRRKLSRRTVTQRVVLMRLAHDCAKVVQTQNRLASAATVLQRSWRAVLDARIVRLGKDVGSFQMLARGWVVRRKTREAIACGASSNQSLRIMGGW